jgi:hypothetical protein
MGIFFSCTARILFRNPGTPRRISDENVQVFLRKPNGDVGPKKKRFCRSHSCACHTKLNTQLSINDGVVVHENIREGVDVRKSMVMERVTLFEGLMRKSRSMSYAESLHELEVVDEKKDPCGVELTVEFSLEAESNGESASPVIEECQVVVEEILLPDCVE